MSTRAEIPGSKVTAFPTRQDANSQPSDKGSDKHLVPVSERVEGQTVLGRISAMVAKGCPGPAMRGGCVREFGHEGEHMGEGEFIPYLKTSLVEVQDGVSKLKAERDELLAALKDLRAACVDLYKCGRLEAYAFVSAGNVIAKAEEGR